MPSIFLTPACLHTILFSSTWFSWVEKPSPGLLPWQPFTLLATMNLWYAVTLLISVSLVCAATRQEEMSSILQHAARFAIWVVVFMGIVMVALTLLGWLT